MHSNFFTGQSLVFYNGPVSGRVLAHFCVHFYRGSTWLCFDPMESSNFDTMGIQKDRTAASESRAIRGHQESAQRSHKELSSQRTSTVLSLFWYTAGRCIVNPIPRLEKRSQMRILGELNISTCKEVLTRY